MTPSPGVGQVDGIGERAQPERKTDELLVQGEEFYRAGRYQQAFHVWTRILFLDRANAAVRERIDHAKRAIAERQRKLDLMVVEAARYLERGERRRARRQLARALALDPRHSEGRSLWERLEALERRGGAPAPARSPSPEPLEETLPRSRSRPLAKTENPNRHPSASPLKMAAFLFCAFCLFGLGGLYLHLNWAFLVGDDAFAGSRPPAGLAPDEGDSVALPSLAELHFFNGARLYAKGQYREALSELARVDRRCGCFEEARNLILRSEERLLREAIAANSAQGRPRAGR